MFTSCMCVCVFFNYTPFQTASRKGSCRPALTIVNGSLVEAPGISKATLPLRRRIVTGAFIWYRIGKFAKGSHLKVLFESHCHGRSQMMAMAAKQGSVLSDLAQGRLDWCSAANEHSLI